MNDEHWRSRKVVIVGAGAVGSTFAYALAQSGLADEIALRDSNHELAMGQVLDLAHGQVFFPSVQIREAQVADYADARMIVITAGAKQRSGESRLELLQRNAIIIHDIIDEIARQKSPAVVLVVSNPVDILTYVAHKRSGWSRGRIIGSGTVLDSARFRHLLSQRCGVDVHNVHAYILGEHGDSEFAAWSMTNMAGMPIEQFCRQCAKCDDRQATRRRVVDEVKSTAYHIIDYKGATWFAVGLALTRIAAAVLRNQHGVLTVSAVLEGEYGLSGVSLGVPCIVSLKGVEKVLQVDLPPDEQDALVKSAAALREVIEKLELPAPSKNKPETTNHKVITMNNTSLKVSLTALTMLAAAAFLSPNTTRAHCDTLDGPVVAAARTALEKGDVTPVLKWVKKDAEADIRAAFQKTLAVRGKGAEAKDLANRYFFETLVRVHRAGEGAPYTGLKPAGAVEPPVAAADKALDKENADELAKEVSAAVAAGIKQRFARALEAKKHAEHNIGAGREYVEAYVDYVHFVERIHTAAATAGATYHQHKH